MIPLPTSNYLAVDNTNISANIVICERDGGWVIAKEVSACEYDDFIYDSAYEYNIYIDARRPNVEVQFTGGEYISEKCEISTDDDITYVINPATQNNLWTLSPGFYSMVVNDHN